MTKPANNHTNSVRETTVRTAAVQTASARSVARFVGVPVPLSLQLLIFLAILPLARILRAPARIIRPVLIAMLALPMNPAIADTAAGYGGLEDFVRAQVGEQHRVEIRFGELPQGTKLDPCRKIEPFLASGARLWGNSRIGVRCASGANWSVSLPVNVRIFGMGLVTTRPVQARSAIGDTDVRTEEIELTRINGRPLTDVAALDGLMATRSIPVGQPLLSYHVKVRPTVAVGDPIRVRVQGIGFTIIANASALAPGSDGSPLRVRTDTGRVVVGTLNGQTVDVSP